MLGGMTDPSTEAEQYPAGARAVAMYTPDTETHPGEVSLPGYLGAVPSLVGPGGVFTFDAQHIDELTGQAEFEVGRVLNLDDEDDRAMRAEIESIVDATVVPAELRQADELAGERDPDNLKGEALESALDAAGLPKSGTADEKRARLAEAGGPPPEPAPNPPLAAAPAGEPVDTPEGDQS